VRGGDQGLRKGSRRRKRKAEAVTISNVEVDGAKATAEVEFEGGGFNGQVLEVALVEAGGDWKLDQTTGFAKARPAEDRRPRCAKQFEKSPEGLTKGTGPTASSKGSAARARRRSKNCC